MTTTTWAAAAQIAREIVRAELEDNWHLADLLRPKLRAANAERRRLGMKPIRATQAWYFGETNESVAVDWRDA